MIYTSHTKTNQLHKILWIGVKPLAFSKAAFKQVIGVVGVHFDLARTSRRGGDTRASKM